MHDFVSSHRSSTKYLKLLLDSNSLISNLLVKAAESYSGYTFAISVYIQSRVMRRAAEPSSYMMTQKLFQHMLSVAMLR